MGVVYPDRNLPWQWLPLYPEFLWNGSSLAAGFGSGRKVRLSQAAGFKEFWLKPFCRVIAYRSLVSYCVYCVTSFFLQVQCLPHAYVPTVPNSVHPPPQPAAQRERQVWLWAGAAQAVPEAAQSAAGPALRAPIWAEQLQGQQCAQLPHHTGPHGGQTQRKQKDRGSRREVMGRGVAGVWFGKHLRVGIKHTKKIQHMRAISTTLFNICSIVKQLFGGPCILSWAAWLKWLGLHMNSIFSVKLHGNVDRFSVFIYWLLLDYLWSHLLSQTYSPSSSPSALLSLLSCWAGLWGGPSCPRGSWSPQVGQQRLLPASGPDEQSCVRWEVRERNTTQGFSAFVQDLDPTSSPWAI